jgi:hypothetical protein
LNNRPVASGNVHGISSGEVTDPLDSFNPDDINSIDISSYLPLGRNIKPILIIYDDNGNKRATR